MSLDWNAKNVIAWDELHNTAPKGVEPKYPEGSDEDKAAEWEWNKSQTIIFRTMSVGINKITAENAEKFLARCFVVSKVFGAPLSTWDDEKETHVDADLTFADIHRRIGLGTNASTLTDAQFRKRMIEEVERSAQRKARKQVDAFQKEVV